MRRIDTALVSEKVCELFKSANYELPKSVEAAICRYGNAEKDERAKSILEKLTDNLSAAREINVPVCQDTGMAVVFIEIGQEVQLCGELLEVAINNGVKKAYDEGYLRKSIVNDPLFERTNTQDNIPAVIHTSIMAGDKIKIIAAPKGFGSENKSAIKMLNPSDGEKGVIDFVVETVEKAGANPCLPMVVGVGIGGTFEKAAQLSKFALTRDINKRNPCEYYKNLEGTILEKINRLGIGPQGLGGTTTALAVNIEQFPTHIAGLPVAVNISCHATRHEEVTI